MSQTPGALYPEQLDVYLNQIKNTDDPFYNIGGVIRLIGEINPNIFLEIIYMKTKIIIFIVDRVFNDFSKFEKYW